MSKTKWVLLLLVLPAIFFWSIPASSAATSTNNPKTSGKNIKTYSYVDQNGVTQLATIDCSGVSGIPGINALCGALDSGLTTLGASISQSIGAITENFINLLKSKLWDILFGKDMGIVTLTLQGFNNMLWGIDPGSYNAQSASIDQQKPVSQGFPPFKLIAAIYQNPPNMETVGALAYTVNKNLLGVTTVLAMNCGDPNTPYDPNRPDAGQRTKSTDFYKNHGPTEACPGRVRLNPMYPIWEGIRDIAYVTVVLILVIFGLMVMFRSKIDPRTVITVQSAIPRLAIGLVAIAFSYIIASLAVDIGQVGLAAVGQFFNRIAALNLPIEKSGGGALSPFPYFDTLRGFNDKLSLNYDYNNIPLIPSVIGLIAWMIIFQVFFALVTNYAQIFVRVALGPLVIALGIIPGQSDALSKWFKGLLANALVFPGIYFIVNIIVYIDTYVNSLYMPSPLNDDIKSFVMLGLFVIASKVPAVIEEFLGTQSSGAVSRAGADVSQMARKIPVVGTFF